MENELLDLAYSLSKISYSSLFPDMVAQKSRQNADIFLVRADIHKDGEYSLIDTFSFATKAVLELTHRCG